ncbi:MAG: winged helix-turn-helix domain-containing protein [Candidatus Parvarchaeota archaeon]
MEIYSFDERKKEERKSAFRRSELETMCDVLKIISQGISRPTRIMYKANLSWTKLQQIFSTLEKLDMIMKEPDGKHLQFSLTKKGYLVLSTYNEILTAFGRIWVDETMWQ